MYITEAFVLFVLAEDTVIVPEARDVRVPTEVMFGCAFVVTTAARGTVPVTFAPASDDNPDAGPVKLVAVTPARLVAPDTASEVRVPCDVIAGCAAAETVRALVESGTVPVTFAPVSNESPVPTPTNEPEVVAPVTPRETKVPTDVMFGCALPVTDVAVAEVEIVPTIFAARIPESPAPLPKNEVELVIPPTVSPVKVPTEVIDG